MAYALINYDIAEQTYPGIRENSGRQIQVPIQRHGVEIA